MELGRHDEKEGMIMQKDSVRDYITTAFRAYSALNCPDEYEIHKMNRKEALKLDLLAVNKTIVQLSKNKQHHIIRAVEDVYFVEPLKKIRKNEIRNRVLAFANQNYASERNVWYWLKQAIHICAEYRGLNTSPLHEILD